MDLKQYKNTSMLISTLAFLRGNQRKAAYIFITVCASSEVHKGFILAGSISAGSVSVDNSIMLLSFL